MGTVIIDTALQQGFLYAIAVFGIVISFRMMNFPDLTVDGSFTLGGAVLAKLLVSGYSIGVSICFACVAGFLAGIATALLNRKFGISKILSGILIALILYSINLRIMGKANISLLRIKTIFTYFENIDISITFLFLAGVVLIATICLCYFSITRLGLFIRATGDNEFMVRSTGVNTDWTYVIGIGFANSLIAFSGAMVSQSQGFADINMGIGVVLTLLAALIIGESFISLFQIIKRLSLNNSRTKKVNEKHLPVDMFNEFFAGILGAVFYFLIIAICLQLGLAQTDLKLATSALVIAGLALRFKKTTSDTYQKTKL